MAENLFADVLNVREMGAAGDGVRDDTAAVQASFDRLAGGGTLYFPAGKYLVTKSVRIRGDYVHILGQGGNSRVIYAYEQQEKDTGRTASLFVFREGITGVSVRDMKLEYTGSFFPNFGESYNGKVSALYFSQCFDVEIRNLDVSGFNGSGVCLLTGDSGKYAKRFLVDRCHLHHNRVAGVLFGYVDQISITNCDLEYQGSVLDGGTGYGCGGASGELPRHIQIIGNRAAHNYRKGIDLHAGIDAVIEGNICHANRLYGIYAEGPRTGNIVIRGNQITGMERESLDISEPYTWITGIEIGPYVSSPAKEDYHNYIVEGNEIVGFGLGKGSAYPISCYFNFERGTVQIKDNIIRAGKITNLISFKTRVEGSRDVKTEISGNQAYIGECTGYPCVVSAGKMAGIHDNQISVDVPAAKSGVFLLDAGDSCCVSYTGNMAEAPGAAASLVMNRAEGPEVFRSGNFLNGKPV